MKSLLLAAALTAAIAIPATAASVTLTVLPTPIEETETGNLYTDADYCFFLFPESTVEQRDACAEVISQMSDLTSMEQAPESLRLGVTDLIAQLLPSS